MFKKYVILLIIAIFIVAGAIFIAQKNAGKENKLLPLEIKNDDNQISGWQTYHNDQFGFEIKYPKEWENNIITPKKIYFQQKTNKDIRFNIFMNQDVEFYGFYSYKPSEEIVINGISSRINFYKNNKDGQIFIYISIKKENISYTFFTFSYSDEKAIENLFLNIFSTFKFTNN